MHREKKVPARRLEKIKTQRQMKKERERGYNVREEEEKKKKKRERIEMEEEYEERLSRRGGGGEWAPRSQLPAGWNSREVCPENKFSRKT